MTTEMLFRDDAYLRTATARVLAVGERGIERLRPLEHAQGIAAQGSPPVREDIDDSIGVRGH